jgi:hypothetical protein
MPTEGRPQSDAEILSALHILALDTEDEILGMSREEVRAGLIEEGLDPDANKAKLAELLKTIRAQQRLAAAREAREAQEGALSPQRPTPALDYAQIRAEVSRRLGLLSPTGSAQVQVAFNRFKEASDEDLPGLLDDLRLLEALDQKDDAAHG